MPDPSPDDGQLTMKTSDSPTIVQAPLAPTPPAPSAGERFTPGTLIANRYRIISLLGKGGMGEVYRADDTKLGQPVALKFLPRRLASNREALDQFFAEVRLGRQVSHPNVCRLYDISEHENHPFIAMEYVDGEDLATLLRRIGRLPDDKAIDVARGIAAGLTAAHDTGIVHRDLKPSNIMIDGSGRARITDFGLAALERESADGRIIGTPAYMAPEQLSGEAATPRSDLYSYGLILFECFTGKQVYRGESGAAILKERMQRSAAASLTSTAGIPKDVDRIIRQCLEPDPERRPASARSVMAMLPGGDPLAAAVAAGETPSPELVAATSQTGELSLRAAWTFLSLALVGVALLPFVTREAYLYLHIGAIRGPQVLRERAAELRSLLGYSNAGDQSSWYNWDRDLIKHAQLGQPATLPRMLLFHERTSPRPMRGLDTEQRIFDNDPPLDVPGMTTSVFDARGGLVRFTAVPPPKAVQSPAAPDWGALHRFAGIIHVQPATPEWTPPVGADQHIAWNARTREGAPVRLEAAARAGSIVWAAVIEPWEKPPASLPPTQISRIGQIGAFIITFCVPVAVVLLARRNLRLRRGDRRIAYRLALFVFLAMGGAKLFRAHHVSDLGLEVVILIDCVAGGLFWGAVAGLGYLGLEPSIRRRWPNMLVSWIRLWQGRFRDAMVGRDVLIGATAGIGLYLFSRILHTLPIGGAPFPALSPASTLGGASHNLFFIGNALGGSILDVTGVLVLLLISRLALRSDRLAIAGLIVLATIILIDAEGSSPAMKIMFALAGATLGAIVLFRAGALGVATMSFVVNLALCTPVSLDPDAWYFPRGMVMLAFIVMTAIAAFKISLNGKHPLGRLAEET